MYKKLLKVLRIWQEAVNLEKSKPGVKRERDEIEFLPAAVEILESPASPVGHAIALLIMGLFFIMVLWATFGRIDMVAVSHGRIIPGGHVKVVQPFEPGVVQEILVLDGQRVEKGDLLIKLDPLEAEVDKEKLEKENQVALLEIARLEAFLAFLEDDYADYEPFVENSSDIELSAAHQQQLQSEKRVHIAQLEKLDGEKSQLQAQLHAVEAGIIRLNALIPLSEEHESALFTLLSKKLLPKPEWIKVKRELIDLQQSLVVETRRLEEIELAIGNKEKEINETHENARRDTLIQLKEFRNQSELVLLSLRKAKNRETRNNLVSPVVGTVQQLNVHTVGGVVKAADQLMIIVPDNTQLVVESLVLNKDIGFVEVGQPVEIKVESFPFTKYGLIEGEVIQLSADAVQDENLGLVYTMRSSMTRAQILVNGKSVDLSPGMTVTAEVKIGERVAIEYFLSPLLRYRQEVFRER